MNPDDLTDRERALIASAVVAAVEFITKHGFVEEVSRAGGEYSEMKIDALRGSEWAALVSQAMKLKASS